MTRIELPEDYPQPGRIVVAQALLRLTLGLMLAAHAAQRLLGFTAWEDELAMRFALLEPEPVARALLGLELAGAACLVLGWYTRLGAFILLCSSVGTGLLEAMRLGGFALDHSAALQLPVLLGIGAVFFLLSGGGPASLDSVLRERARRRAIEKDNIWLKHPYVEREDLPYAETFEGRLARRR